MTTRLMVGNCREILPTLPADAIDACVTDPPYGLGFMGKDWDHGVPGVQFWREVKRVLKPGAHLVAFGGTRTHHRLTCAIEDAGFEIRDCLGWLYGSGFPKSKDIGNGWGTALKPAWEPIILARKPLSGTVAANVQEYGTGALNIDACRIEVTDESYTRNCSGDHGHEGTRSTDERGATDFRPGGGSAAAGRWPANICHDGSEEVLAVFPSEAGAFAPVKGTEPSNASKSVFGQINRHAVNAFHGDSGSAARFFYCAKASREDRNEGLYGFPRRRVVHQAQTLNNGSGGLRNGDGLPTATENHHPTVKPTDLMRWLCRLVTPKGGTVLDPFMGSGSTGKAAEIEGFHFIGIDIDPEYAEIARARIVGTSPLFAQLSK